MNTHILFSLWTAVLLLTAAVPQVNAECLIPCPGDLNDDCQVDLQDFMILAQNWLTDCSPPSDLPVLTVTEVGVDPAQAEALAQALRLPRQLLVIEDGQPLLFIDPEKHLALPTVPVQDEQLIRELLKDTPDVEDGSEIVFEAIDEQALLKIIPTPPRRR
ncbi:MAG TPA: hypothetical protein ENN97_08185 [Phycisphaerales bacterium]|nr:hypothetical protein [Phycisphaerales bacterium]